MSLSENTRVLVEALDFTDDSKSHPSDKELRSTLADLFAPRPHGGEEEAAAAAAGEPAPSLSSLFPNASPVGLALSVLSLRLAALKTIPAMSALFLHFTADLRSHWNNLTPVPNVSSPAAPGGAEECAAGGVDRSHGIMEQKLQMLQCCIFAELERKKREEEAERIRAEEGRKAKELEKEKRIEEEEEEKKKTEEAKTDVESETGGEEDDEENEENEENAEETVESSESLGEGETLSIRSADAPQLTLTHVNSSTNPPVLDPAASEEAYRSSRREMMRRVKGSRISVKSIKSRTDEVEGEESEDDDEFFDTQPLPSSPSRSPSDVTLPPKRNRRAPQTIDMILQRRQMLALLGADAGELSMRLNEPMFTSDAQAFKACNGEGSWEQFRTWIGGLEEYKEFDGEFVDKLEPLFNGAEALAAELQEPCFTPLQVVQEAEKVLNWFESLPVYQLLSQVLSNVIATAFFVLKTAPPYEVGRGKDLAALEVQIDEVLRMLQAEVEGRDALSEIAENVAVSQGLLDEIEIVCDMILDYEEGLSFRLSLLGKTGRGGEEGEEGGEEMWRLLEKFMKKERRGGGGGGKKGGSGEKEKEKKNGKKKGKTEGETKEEEGEGGEEGTEKVAVVVDEEETKEEGEQQEEEEEEDEEEDEEEVGEESEEGDEDEEDEEDEEELEPTTITHVVTGGGGRLLVHTEKEKGGKQTWACRLDEEVESEV